MFGKEENALEVEEEVVFPFQAEATLVLNKAHQGKDGKLESVSFSIEEGDLPEINKKPKILSPRIVLDGAFFDAWVDSGRPENYEVRMTIVARRTDFVHKGIGAEPEAEEDEKTEAPEE